jgi:hypothetical protein
MCVGFFADLGLSAAGLAKQFTAGVTDAIRWRTVRDRDRSWRTKKVGQVPRELSDHLPADGERSACRGLDERSRCGDRAAPVGELLIEQRSCTEHVWPDLQRDPNVRRAGPRGDLGCIVEQGLGAADLNEQRRQTLEIGIQRGGKRRPRRSPSGVSAGQAAYRRRALAHMVLLQVGPMQPGDARMAVHVAGRNPGIGGDRH